MRRLPTADSIVEIGRKSRSWIKYPLVSVDQHTSNRYLAWTPLRRQSTPSLMPVCLTARRTTTRVSREEVPSVTCRPRVTVVWCGLLTVLWRETVTESCIPRPAICWRGSVFTTVCLSVYLFVTLWTAWLKTGRLKCRTGKCRTAKYWYRTRKCRTTRFRLLTVNWCALYRTLGLIIVQYIGRLVIVKCHQNFNISSNSQLD